MPPATGSQGMQDVRARKGSPPLCGPAGQIARTAGVEDGRSDNPWLRLARLPVSIIPGRQSVACHEAVVNSEV